MISKIKNRLAAEQGFTLIELLVVIVILGILVAIAVPSYLSLTGNAKSAAGAANVRSAIPAAEILYQNVGDYSTVSSSTMNGVSPGISPSVTAAPLNSDAGYCLQSTNGSTVYSYAGGDPGTLASGYQASTITAVSCDTLTGLTLTLS